MKRLALFLLLGGSAGCASMPERPHFEPFPVEATPNAEDFPVVPAIMLLDRGELTLDVDARSRTPIAKLRHYRRIKILREPGLSAAEIILPYDPQTTIVGLIARGVAPDGATLSSSRIADVEHESGTRAKAVTIPGAEVGTVIEFTYDALLEDPRFIRPWRFRRAIPTVRSEYAVVLPEGLSVDYRSTDMGKQVDRPPERFDVELGTRLSWTMTDLPPMFLEPGTAVLSSLAPTLHVVFTNARRPGTKAEGFGTWNDFRSWFFEKRSTWSRLTPEQKAEARRIAGETSAEEQALKLMSVVSRDLAWDPGPRVPLWRATAPAADIVLNMKHGNATSRGLLLVALLKGVGIDAVPALYAYRDRGMLFPDLPTPHTVDGIVAVVQRPEGLLVLDPGQLTVSAAVASPRLQGARIVVLREDGAEIQRVPVSRPEDSRTRVNYKLNVDATGGLTGSVEATLTGAEAGTLRDALLGREPGAFGDIVTGFLAARGAPLSLDSVNIADLRELRRPLTIRGSITPTRLYEAEPEETTVSFDLAKILASKVETRELRKFPIVQSAPYVAEVNARLFLPEDHDVEAVPEGYRTEWEQGFTELSARKETRRRIGLTRKTESRGILIEPKDYPKFREYTAEIAGAVKSQVLFKRPPPKQLEY